MTNQLLQFEVEKFIAAKPMKKKDFAVLIGISPVKLSRWLNGRVSLNQKTIDNIKVLLAMASNE